MTQQTKTWVCSKDTLVAQEISGGTNYGAGNCNHLPVGRSINDYGPVRQRSFLDFTPDWTGVVQIVKVELKMRVTSNRKHVDLGASRHVRAQRAAASWAEGSKGSDERIYTSNATHYGNQPGVTGTASAAVSVPGGGSWVSVDITTAVEEIAPSSVKLRSGAAGSGSGTWNGVRIIACDSGGAEQLDGGAFASEFSSHESSDDPYVLLTFSDNQPPATPVLTSPVDGATHSSSDGQRVTAAGSYSDPDGDSFGGGTVQIYDDTATDDANGTILTGITVATINVPSSAGSSSTWSHVISGALIWTKLSDLTTTTAALSKQTWYKLRAQVKDPNGAYSSWCRLVRFKTNAQPAAPSNPYFQDDTVTNPIMAASLSDPDTGAFITAYEPEVYYDHPTLGSITYWAPGKTSLGGTSTRASFTYQGTQLVLGTQYRWRIRLYDNQDVASPWTANLYVTPRLATGPSNMTPRDVEAKQNTRTPSLSINHSTNFDQYKLQVYDNATGTGTPLWDVPTQTVASTATVVKTYGDNTGLTGASTAVALDWGNRYYWRAAVRVVGNPVIADFGPLYPFYINALPAAPVIGVSA